MLVICVISSAKAQHIPAYGFVLSIFLVFVRWVLDRAPSTWMGVTSALVTCCDTALRQHIHVGALPQLPYVNRQPLTLCTTRQYGPL
jgi:hypothetical protein